MKIYIVKIKTQLEMGSEFTNLGVAAYDFVCVFNCNNCQRARL